MPDQMVGCGEVFTGDSDGTLPPQDNDIENKVIKSSGIHSEKKILIGHL